MTATATTAPPGKSRHGWLKVVAGIGAFILTGLLGLGLVGHVRRPKPPEVSTTDAGPGVAEDIAEASSAVRRRPSSADSWGNLGLVLHLYGYFDEAGVCYARAAQLAPHSPRWPYLQAVILLRTDLESAVPLLERSVELGGEVQTPRLVLGETLLLRNRPEEAEVCFQKVLEAELRNARALLGLGRAAYQKGDLASARDFLERSAEAAPRIRATQALLAQVYHRLDDGPRAADARSAAAALPEEASWPDPYRVGTLSGLRGESAVIFRATTLCQQGQGKQAVALLQEALHRHPQSHTLYRALGRAHVASAEYESAATSYREAIRLHPNSLESQFECGLVLAQLEQRKEAAACFRQALRLRPEFGEAHYRLGRCLESLASGDDAIAAYRQAVRYQPNLVAAHQALGAMLARKHEDAEALKVLQRALDLDPTHEETRRQLAIVKARQ